MYLLQKIKYRRLKECIKICNHCLENKKDFPIDEWITTHGYMYSVHIITLMKTIRSEIGYYAKDIVVERIADISENIEIIEEALENLNISESVIDDEMSKIFSWVREHFIEGEHYLYTV